MARMTKYDTHIAPNLSAIRKMRESGARMSEIAKVIGVGSSTLRSYQSKHPELAKILDDAKVVLDADIKRLAEEGLKAKLQPRWVEIKRNIEIIESIDGTTKTVTHVEEKWVEPDTTAVIFALKAVAPAKWNKTEHDLIQARKAKVEAETERIKQTGDDGTAELLARLGAYGGSSE